MDSQQSEKTEAKIIFNEDEDLGAVISQYYPICQLSSKRAITHVDQITINVCGSKYAKLCGFKFESNLNVQNKKFAIVFCPKTRFSRKNQHGLSGWYCWKIIDNNQTIVMSKEDIFKEYKFDVDSFFMSDVFLKYVPRMVKQIREAMVTVVRQFINNIADYQEKRMAERYQRSIIDSLRVIDKPLEDQELAYNANHSYVLKRHDDIVTAGTAKDEQIDDVQPAVKESKKKSIKNNFFQLDSLNESILDFPKNDLCPTVWQINQNGEYYLTQEANYKITKLLNSIRAEFNLFDLEANLTGSITSNTYSDKSDIDIHVRSDRISEDQADEFTRILRKWFKEIYSAQNQDDVKIGIYPIELYFQTNSFQDMMSVGCYDLVHHFWIVMPNVKSIDFDPYAEYYTDDIEHLDDILDDIRSIILKAYEESIIYLKAKDEQFKSELQTTLLKTIITSVDIFEKLRNHRKISSTPTSAMQALKARTSDEWIIADSSFKLLDKFGYTGILYEIVQCKEKLDTNELTFDEAAEIIVKTVDEKLSAKNLIDEKDEEFHKNKKMIEAEEIDEGIGKLLSIGTLVSMLSIPSALASSISDNELAELIKSEKTYQDVQAKLQNDDLTMYGSWNELKALNIIARTLFAEAHDQGLSNIKLIATVIWNRSGSNPDKLADTCLIDSQFSCWNSFIGTTKKTSSGFDIDLPSILKKNYTSDNIKIWNQCKEIAADMLLKKFTPISKNINAYYNSKLVKKTPYWDKMMINRKKYGDHTTGYLYDQDGYSPKQMTLLDYGKKLQSVNKTGFQAFAKKYPAIAKKIKPAATDVYIVKSGDNLSKIAQNHKMTMKQLLAKNPQIKNPNKISIGQKINI